MGTIAPAVGRPFVRTVVNAVILVVGLAGIAILTLSDKIPLLAERGLSRIDPQLGSAVDALFHAGHLLAWATMAFAATLLLTTVVWRSLALVALVAMAVLATGLEYAQSFASATREMSRADAYANLQGIAVGAALGVVVTIGVLAARRSRTP